MSYTYSKDDPTGSEKHHLLLIIYSAWLIGLKKKCGPKSLGQEWKPPFSHWFYGKIIFDFYYFDAYYLPFPGILHTPKYEGY